MGHTSARVDILACPIGSLNDVLYSGGRKENGLFFTLSAYYPRSSGS